VFKFAFGSVTFVVVHVVVVWNSGQEEILTS